jgi:hypothetical protein
MLIASGRGSLAAECGDRFEDERGEDLVLRYARAGTGSARHQELFRATGAALNGFRRRPKLRVSAEVEGSQ